MNDPLLLNYNIITKVNGKTAIELRFVLIPQFLEIHPGERERRSVEKSMTPARARISLYLSLEYFMGNHLGGVARRRAMAKERN